MTGVKMKSLLMVAWAGLLVLLAVFGTGPVRAEFHQPHFQNGFGLDSQLPLMPNLNDHHPAFEAHLLGGNALVLPNPGILGDFEDSPVDYNSSYVRRKEQLMPLITDLIRGVRGGYEVYEAYVLNVDHQLGHSMDRNGTRNETASVVTSVVIEAPNAFQFGGATGAVGGGGSTVATADRTAENLEQFLLNDLPFLDVGADEQLGSADGASMSVLEQNLADLNDFCDSGNGNYGTSYYSFNNVSYNMIPKDLLEATDLFGSSPSFLEQRQGPVAMTSGDGDEDRRQNGTRTLDGEADLDLDENSYLRFIKKEGDEEDEEQEEEEEEYQKEQDDSGSDSETASVVHKLEEEEADSGLENETDGDEQVIGELSLATEIKQEPEEIAYDEDSEIIVKLEAPEENVVIGDEELQTNRNTERTDEVPTKREDQDTEDAAEEVEPRDYFLNGNEVIRRSVRRSSTFDDVRDFEEEKVIGLQFK